MGKSIACVGTMPCIAISLAILTCSRRRRPHCQTVFNFRWLPCTCISVSMSICSIVFKSPSAFRSSSAALQGSGGEAVVRVVSRQKSACAASDRGRSDAIQSLVWVSCMARRHRLHTIPRLARCRRGTRGRLRPRLTGQASQLLPGRGNRAARHPVSHARHEPHRARRILRFRTCVRVR